MILDEQKDTAVVVSGTQEDFEFGISNDGVITDILSNKIYSDKPLAVIREYSCNALDANVENGKADLPIIVTLPTELNPIFSIRDNGKGLTHEQIKKVYVSYGVSTKRASNASIGMFGIGAKSGFAYGEAFIVSSIQNGVRNDYSAFKENKVPKMSLLGSSPTTEADGLEIQIPVRMEDIDLFRNKCRDFFRYWKIKPEIRGGELEFGKEEQFLSGQDWVMYSNQGVYGNRLIAVMGNVPYPIDLASLNLPYNSPFNKISGYPITITFPIGALGVNAGREGLEYDTKTKANIIAKLEEVLKAITERIEKEFASCATMFEAKIKMAELYNRSSPLARMAEIFEKETFKWNGKKIGASQWNNVRSYGDDYGFDAQEFRSTRSSWNSKRPNSAPASVFLASQEALFIINDENAQHGILNRIAPLLDADSTSAFNCLKKRYSVVYLINVKDETKWKAWKDERSFDAPTVNFSTLLKVKLKDVYGGDDSIVPVAAHKTKIFSIDFDCTRSRMKRDYFKCEDIDLSNEGGLYVVIERFFVNVPQGSKIFSDYRSSDGVDPLKVIEFVRELCALKTPKGFMVRYPKVYAVREKDKAKLGPKMKCFFSVMEKQTMAAIHNPEIMAARMERSIATSMENYMFGFLRDKVMKKVSSNHAFNAIFAEQKALRHDDKADKINTLESFARRYNIDISVKVKCDLRERYDALLVGYPMFEMLKSMSHYQWDNYAEHIANYINMVNKTNEVPEIIEEH